MTPWLQITLEVAKVLVPLVGFGLLWQQLRQKTTNDDRSDWWTRFEWALERIGHDDADVQEVAWAVLDSLVKSESATNHDKDVLLELGDRRNNRTSGADNPSQIEHNGATSSKGGTQ